MPAVASTPPVPARAAIRTLDLLNGLAVLALAVFIASFAVRNSDHWLHLASGRLVAAGQFPFGVDPFSAVSPAPPWVNHAWLYDFLLFRLETSFGGAAVVGVKAGLIALMAAILMSCRRRDGERWLPAIFTAIALLTMSPRLLMQPSIISFLFLAILMRLLLVAPSHPNRWRQPLALAVLFGFWVNLDGGFVFGLGVLVLWLVGGILQRWAPFSAGPEDPAERAPSIGSSAMILVCAALACLASPYGHRVFTLPSDWSFLALPQSLRIEDLFRELFRSPLDKDYTAEVAGIIPGGAYFLLLGLGLGSFILNSSEWRWDRALVWLAFAGLSLWLIRMVPYFAVVAAPMTVWNLQTSSVRRTDQPMDARVSFTRSFLGSFGRFVTFLVGLGLLALAWPGGLARDAGASQPERRVAWAVLPDETSVRAARQLATWYDSGQLRPGASQGFHLPFQFGYYCAWYCPAEKIQFDIRMTDPRSIEPYITMRKALLRFRERTDFAPDPTPGVSHVVLTGRTATLLSRGTMVRNDYFPLWAIVGQGLIFGWTKPGEVSSPAPPVLDAVRLAASQPKPAPWIDLPEPQRPTAWERFLTSMPQTPPEAFEAALWLTARDAAGVRAAPALAVVQFAARVGRAAPIAANEIGQRLMEPVIAAQLNAPLNEAWQRGPDGRLSRIAPVLAMQAARRGIGAVPNDFESFARVVAATSLFDGDQDLLRFRQTSFTLLQQVTAARQALQRIPIAASFGVHTAAEELSMQTVLQQYYERAPVFDGTDIQPLDLLLESRTRSFELEAVVFDRVRKEIPSDQLTKFEEAYVADRQKKRERLDALKAEVKRRSDEYETRAAKMRVSERADLAARFGLPREALHVLGNADPKELTAQSIAVMLHLMLLTGDAADARTILQGPSFNPITVLPPELQPAFRALSLNTAVALGDTSAAIEMMDHVLKNQPQSLGRPLAGTLQWLVFPDLGLSPLTRGISTPMWFGMFSKNGPNTTGQLLDLQMAIQHYCNNFVRQGLLAVESGDIPLAKNRFHRALEVAGNSPFELRGPAVRWLEFFEN